MSIYSKEFKEKAMRLYDEIGSKKAAARLGIPYYTPADRRNRSKLKPKETATMSEEELRNRNREFEKDNAELREANNILRTHSVFSQKAGRGKDLRTTCALSFIINIPDEHTIKLQDEIYSRAAELIADELFDGLTESGLTVPRRT